MAKKIGLCRLSDPISQDRIQDAVNQLKQEGHEVYLSPYLDQDVDGKRRVDHLNQWFREDFDFIFDVSGGDLAIECIPWLEPEAYQNSTCLFCGYSDLTPVLNVLGQKKKTLWFQIRHHEPFSEVLSFIESGVEDLLYDDRVYSGGNIRCLLKLAGTPYFPDLSGKNLFLESHSGSLYRIRSYLAQLEQMGIFQNIRSLTLGQFTQLDQAHQRAGLAHWGNQQIFPVKHTNQIGHSKTSKALWIQTDSDIL